MMEWISIEDRMPSISFPESDNVNDPYESCPVLVYSSESPGIQCVAYLVKEQDENDLNFGDLSWELYIPGNGGDIVYKDLDIFSHWMPLPEPPKGYEFKECPFCKNPYLDNGTFENCIWCEIHKEEK